MRQRALITLAAVAAFSFSSNAVAVSQRVGTPYYGAVAVEASTGRVLVADNAREAGYPASITKMMTFLLMVERIERGELNLSDKVYITVEAQRVGGRQVWLEANEIFTVEELFYALMVHSANDVARALALHVSPSRDAFVQEMNKRAQELGMFGANYVSEHGLPPSNGAQPDTANAMDISILARELLKHPLTLKFTSTKFITFRDGTMDLRNSNKLLGVYPGIDGLKTGFHSAGGFSIATTAEREGERIVAVVLGCPSSKVRNKAVSDLMDKAFTKLAEIRATEPKVIPVAEPEPILEIAEPAGAVTVAEKTPSKRKGGRWLIVGALILAGAGAVGLVLTSKKNDPV